MFVPVPDRAGAGVHVDASGRLGSRRHARTADPERLPVDPGQWHRPARELPSPGFHGSGALWTVLPPDGIDKGGHPGPDGSTSQKYPWWTVGTTGQLTIQGRRLDAPAPPLHAQVNSGTPETGFAEVPDGRFWASSISFPTEGCWQVTGTAGHASLTFVVLKAHT